MCTIREFARCCCNGSISLDPLARVLIARHAEPGYAEFNALHVGYLEDPLCMTVKVHAGAHTYACTHTHHAYITLLVYIRTRLVRAFMSSCRIRRCHFFNSNRSYVYVIRIDIDREKRKSMYLFSFIEVEKRKGGFASLERFT